MQEIILNGKKFGFSKDIWRDDILRKSFHALTREVFDFDLEQWYQSGYGREGCDPYVLLDGGTVAANVLASRFEFLAQGRAVTAIQLGTVMTGAAYRRQGLGRFLIEQVLADCENSCDFVFLFANDTVLDYYPKFGFVRTQELVYSKPLAARQSALSARRLDMASAGDKTLLEQAARRARPVGRLALCGGIGGVMFHCTQPRRNDCYYIEEMRAAAVGWEKNGTLHLDGIFCERKVETDAVIDALRSESAKRVVLGFAPEDAHGYTAEPLTGEDTLFVRGGAAIGFEQNGLRFPALSHT